MPIPELSHIAARLEGLEETIIARVIDRVQFLANTIVYENGKSGFTGGAQESLFDLRLRATEEMDARFGRFAVAEERPFTTDLPEPSRQVTLPDTGLMIDSPDRVNVTAAIKTAYLDFIPRVCREGDDGQHGSSVEHDVHALQAISRRIHYGALYVAESKYRGDPAAYRQIIDRKDTGALMDKLTRVEVEHAILARVAEKVDYQQQRVNHAVRKVIDPEAVLSFYRDAIIPLTKEGEIRYLLNRVP